MSKDTPRPLPQDEIERTSDFRAAELSGQDFSKMGLPQRDFRRALLRGAKFVGCDLQGANFADAELSGANFKDANLQDVDFSNANLTKANFYKANLVGAAFLGSNLFAANFRESKMGQTVFSTTDMETCVGLDSVVHEAPSSIAVDCLFRSGHNLPLSFLAGAGMPKLLLDYVPELVQATTPIQFHSCFISYSHLDEAFARRLWSSLRNERIRVWYAPEEMQGGRKLFEQIDRAIQLHDKLLVVLSKAGLASEWVRTEIKRARRKERQTSDRKLFPIRLCGIDELRAWECFDADTGRDIAEEVREYFIPDFSDWTKPARFEVEFTKLRRDLRKEGVPMRATK